MAKAAGIQNSDPPLWVAWNQAKASIRVRFFRQLITSLGIALGIAFFASVLTMRAAGGDQTAAEESRMRWLLGTSLVMCLVGVTNSMLMSVAERYREIGTIKCLGASDSFIVRVFFLESLLLGTAGSSIGAILGSVPIALIQRLFGQVAPWRTVLEIVILATVSGIAMTVAAAIAPAIQAARMPAAAALRVDV